MLRTKLFLTLALIVVLFAVASALFAIRAIQRHVVKEAQNRVRLDLSAARALYDGRLQQISDVLRLVALKPLTVETFERGAWEDEHVRSRLERIRVSFGLDFLDLVDTECRVCMRTAPPYQAGDYRTSKPVLRALRGEEVKCTTVLSRAELEREADGLADRAFIEVLPTPRARPSAKAQETRGMVMVGAVPVYRGAAVVGVVYGGILLNRRHEITDRVCEVLYKNQQYRGVPMGTSTLFLDDVRIATTVRQANGHRALGTRVSREVAERVLDNGEPWIGRAFVVKEEYLTAYEPIHDEEGSVIGMLYVGILKAPFDTYTRGILTRYISLAGLMLGVVLVVSFIVAGRLAGPIHRLVEASRRLSEGHPAVPVHAPDVCRETSLLVRAFNEMTGALAEREEKLKALNRSYMETLGFVAHELKSPVATITNYLYLLREQKLGPLTELQKRAVQAIDGGSRRLVEMVRHYLNLSRIENRELQPVRQRVEVQKEILSPLLEAEEPRCQERAMTIVNQVPDQLCLHADANMVREVFENLLSNALKYGRRGGTIRISAEPEGSWVRFRVRNDGEGIAPDKIPLLFQKFTRLETTPEARRERGSGLGLFITKHIVIAHGGTIEALSLPGQWAEFVFTLPVWSETREMASPSDPAPPKHAAPAEGGGLTPTGPAVAPAGDRRG